MMENNKNDAQKNPNKDRQLFATATPAIRMSANRKMISVELAAEVVGTWKETYQWIPIFGGLAAFALAFLAGSNNLPTSFSLPVASGTITFLRAVIAAFVVYVPGTVFARNDTVSAIFSNFLKENQENQGFLMWSMIVVLITATLWLAIATYFELPVSSQQSTQVALLGTMLVTKGFGFIPLWNKNENHNFNGGGLLWFFLEWTVAPIIACGAAFLFFKSLKIALLHHENAEKRILIFLPIYFGVTAGLLCLFIMYQILPKFMSINMLANIVAITIATLIGALSSLAVVIPLARTRINSKPHETVKQTRSAKQECVEEQDRASNTNDVEDDEKIDEMLRAFMQMRVLDTVYEEDERSGASPLNSADGEQMQPDSQLNTGHSTPFRQLLESTPNQLVQTRNFENTNKATATHISDYVKDYIKSTCVPVIKYDRRTLVRHALAEKFDDIEDFFGFPLLLSSCIFALIQSANEVGPLMSPYGAILDVFNHREKYSGNGENVDSLVIKWWIRAVGGLGASTGFFLCGWRLIHCLGSRVTYTSNSRGMASLLSSVATLIVVSRMKLPVSSVHTFIGALVGVGIADEPRNVNWKLLLKFLGGWIGTLIFCCFVAYGIFSASIHTPAYVVA